MCEYEHIKGSVDEETLLSNAQQRSEKGLCSASHETELLSEGLKTIEKASCSCKMKKMCISVSPQIPELNTTSITL